MGPLEVIPVLFMLIAWVLPIALVWWLVRTLEQLKRDVRRIAEVVERDHAPAE